MSDQGNQRGGRGNGQGNRPSANFKDGNRKPSGSSSGERRYGKPAGDAPRSFNKPAGDGERRYGKPAGDAPRSYGKPAGDGERRYGKPAGSAPRSFSKPAGDGEHRYGKPAGSAPRSFGKPTGDSERRYGKPAGDAPRSFSKPAGDGERRFAKPAGSAPRSFGKPTGDGERRYAKPAGSAPRSFGKPAGDGERRFAKPAGSAPRSFGKPAGDGERRFAKPAGSAPRSFGKPAGDGERRFAKPAGDGERRFAKPAGDGERRYAKPAGDAPRSFVKPAGGAPRGDRRPFSAGIRPVSGNRPFGDRPRYADRDAAAQPVERTGLTPGARRVALDVLRDVHEHGAYASLALQDRLTKAKLSPADRRLTTSIVYSTLEQQIQIDFALDRLMDHPTNEPMQRDILRLSACQILFHDRVPDSAAVNEGVNLARLLGMEGASGFLNAVLRNLVRAKAEIPWPRKEDDLREYLHIMGSMPMWLVDKLIAVYGETFAEAIILHRGQNHPMVLRPNLMKFDDAAFEALLNGKAWTWQKGLAPHAYLVSGATEIALDNDYRAGNFSIQGQSSIFAAEAVQVKPGMRVLDACAAPGGKSCYMAETMQGTGRVFAWELHEKRALLLESAKRRLHLENLRISVRDAADPKPDYEGVMDAVLLDAPCTGLGVLTEKPDLKYRLQEKDIAPIVESQKKLLNTLHRYVRPGGLMVYSTCSILPEENEGQIREFLQEHPEFSLEPLPLSYPESVRQQQSPYGLQLFAHRDGVEGFFIARMRKARA